MSETGEKFSIHEKKKQHADKHGFSRQIKIVFDLTAKIH